MATNKILFDGVGIDLTSDTVTSAADIKSGKVGHLQDGSVATGTLEEGIVEVSTAAEMSSKLSSGAVDSIYEYTGTTTSDYVNGRLYRIEEYVEPPTAGALEFWPAQNAMIMNNDLSFCLAGGTYTCSIPSVTFTGVSADMLLAIGAGAEADMVMTYKGNTIQLAVDMFDGNISVSDTGIDILFPLTYASGAIVGLNGICIEFTGDSTDGYIATIEVDSDITDTDMASLEVSLDCIEYTEA